jgi:predicted CXXCH cytochrome family protein
MIRLPVWLLVCPIALCATSSKTAVIGSQHDLSVTGGGPVKSAALDACIFCHAPHNVLATVTPLWDQTLSIATYTTYSSTTYSSGAQTPSAGSSRLCLSCHDGTVGLGLTVAQGQIATSGAMNRADILGTNLANSHPVSMLPADDGSLAPSLFASPPATKDPAVKLVAGRVECTTCHDPHVPRNDPALPMFLVRANANGALCLACHDPGRPQSNPLNGWAASSHATATNAVPATASVGPYGTVAANACASCHGAHNNASAPRNQKAVEEAACAPCHTGPNVSPSLSNIMGEFSKTYAHPTMTVSGVHDPAEGVPVNNARHAECSDCHNPHAAAAQPAALLPPALDASLTGVTGFDTTGLQTPAAREFQVCYKCHSDSTNKPAASTYGRTAPRYPAGPLPAGVTVTPLPADPYNLRLKFQSTISHNVAGNSVPTTAVPSLLAFVLDINKANILGRALSRTAPLYCSDCHNNNQARSAGGTGPNGPHGSTFPHLLSFNLYQEGGAQARTGTAYDLCARCHNLTTLNNDNGVHRKHLSGDVNAACTTCHDPHGVIRGNPVSNLAMINFDTGIVRKSTNAAYFGFYFAGTRFSCYLTCHGQNHNPESYPYP